MTKPLLTHKTPHEIKGWILNYTENNDSPRNCMNCEHYNGPDSTCPVLMENRQKFKVAGGGKCDVWNDNTQENTWYILSKTYPGTLLISVRDVNASGYTPYPHIEIPINDGKIKKALQEVPGKLREMGKDEGQPDMLVNLDPTHEATEQIKAHCEYCHIQYREQKIDFRDIIVCQTFNTSDDLSNRLRLIDIIDTYLTRQGIQESRGEK